MVLVGLLVSACGQLPLASHEGTDVYQQQADAVAAYEGGTNARAEQLLDGVLRVAPNDAENWFRLGNLYARTDRPDQAVDAFQKSLMLRNNDARVWHNLSVVRLRQAQAALAQANALAVDDPALFEKTRLMAEQLQRLADEAKHFTAPHAQGEQHGSDAKAVSASN
jgi:Flp pilus assembly protein TadD